MAGYGSIPSDGGAATQVSDSGTYLGGGQTKLGMTDIGIIAGVSVFFALVIIVIFAWQVYSVRRKRRLAAAGLSDDSGSPLSMNGHGPGGGKNVADQVELKRVAVDDNMDRLPGGGPFVKRPAAVLPISHFAMNPTHRFVPVSKTETSGSYVIKQQHTTIASLLKSLREGKTKGNNKDSVDDVV